MPSLTESEARWLDSLRDGHGPSGTVDPHSIRELVRVAQRMAVVTDEERAKREREHDIDVAERLDKVAAYYRTPRHRRTDDMAKNALYAVRALVREFVNGWAS